MAKVQGVYWRKYSGLSPLAKVLLAKVLLAKFRNPGCTCWEVAFTVEIHSSNTDKGLAPSSVRYHDRKKVFALENLLFTYPPSLMGDRSPLGMSLRRDRGRVSRSRRKAYPVYHCFAQSSMNFHTLSLLRLFQVVNGSVCCRLC